MSKQQYMSAREAADALNITTATLYAYVSRGMIRSVATGEGKREHRYSTDDIEKLIARKQGRRNPEKLVQDALHWGAPVMDSAISLIDNGTLYYRGFNACQLANTHTLEQVAMLIWNDTMDATEAIFDTDIHPSAEKYETMLLQLDVLGANTTPIQTLQTFLPFAEADDRTAYDLRPQSVMMTGARIIRLMASVVAGDVPENISIAEMLQRGWCPDRPESVSLFNAALILCAEHELNSSTFAARTVASAGSTPFAVILAGLACLSGVKHGGYTEKVESFLSEASQHTDIPQFLSKQLRQGNHIPGFGHHLYPDGDPRGQYLMTLLQGQYGDSLTVQLANKLIDQSGTIIGEKPNLDFALAVLSTILGLPSGTALAIFALGRSVGWIGHAIEEYTENRLIRPRARYTGKQPLV